MRGLLICTGIVFLTLTCSAQQVYQFSNYLINPYVYNPAASGLRQDAEFTTNYRRQWGGVSASPTSFYAAGSFSLGRDKSRNFPTREARRLYYSNHPHTVHHGVSMLVARDQFGAFSTTRIMPSYAVHVPLYQDIKVSFSVRTGWLQSGLNRDRLEVNNQNDETFQHFMVSDLTQNNFDIDAGWWLYSNDFFMGYSVLQIARGRISEADVSSPNRLLAHHFLTGGYHIMLREDRNRQTRESENLLLTPATIIRYRPGTPINFDLSLELHYEPLGKLGVSYRQSESIATWFALRIASGIEMAYTFDLSSSAVRTGFGHAHELYLRILLNTSNSRK